MEESIPKIGNAIDDVLIDVFGPEYGRIQQSFLAELKAVFQEYINEDDWSQEAYDGKVKRCEEATERYKEQVRTLLQVRKAA